MQITIVSVLTAALATLSAAAAVPAAPTVSKPLPAKFTLTMTPNVANTGTVVDKFPSVVTIDEGADTTPMGLGGLSHPGLRQIKLTGYRSGTEGVVIHGSDGDHPMSIIPWGEVRFEQEAFGVSVGFVDVNGVLAFDAHDGKGPQTLWMACARHTYTDNWSVWWAQEGKADCVPITLKVVPL